MMHPMVGRRIICSPPGHEKSLRRKMMSMGKVAEISGSKKQKLNTKISTESELVGVDDYMPMIIWVKY